MVVRYREEPGRRALEETQLRDLLGDLRDELGSARAGSDDSHTLPGQIDAVVPLRGVKRRAFEAIQASDVRQFGPVELANRADHYLHLDRFFGSARRLQAKRPGTRFLVERRGPHFGVEADVFADALLVSAITEIVQQHGLRGERVGPVDLLCERVAIKRALDVHARARV